MKTFNYHIKTVAGEASGSVLAKDEESARARLAAQYAGELRDEDDNSLNNDVESIDLEET